ncbi:methylenetetrahydrofolate reductase [Buchnera aphidicola (Hyadaphis tataricae)]|uniref:Methylenetetrahydrofolate reductase n=1 Tax=Buchnera aphidicola (Hyadaphis tataricae) TaxID=1241859 RepID=A0A4D6Y4N3_9GAMM|nr:methylenetetrahydrofolate reductase [Buchnera aphidicola]QCI21374.1 methylenetetrahydrofolate reductase [Buchnera aphidicola (Hyadaphis tataricae)]
MYTVSQYHQDMIYQRRDNIRHCIKCSFELFPPKNSIAEEHFWHVVEKLSKLKPTFFSVTHGANNGERQKTYDFVKKIYKKTGINTAAHLTCVNTSTKELKKTAEEYWNNGIKSIIALRGDTSEKNYKHHMYAVDLVNLLKKIENFDIAVAAYPELHPESKNVQCDIMNLKKKIDAGANRAITQFFFNVEHYLYFRDNCVKNKIHVEIIPGILPVYSFNQLQRFSKMTNVTIPNWMFEIFYGLNSDLVTQQFIGCSIVLDMVKVLSREGVKNFHFYTLNKSEIVYVVCHMLGL